jgi:CheY-like chemotaxis protein
MILLVVSLFSKTKVSLKQMLKTYKVVVVEDDHDLQFLYRFKLEREGFTVEGAGNGLEALKVVKKLKPDIILLDLMMPVMSGSDMLARLRSEEWASEIRVIILTNLSKHEAPQALRLLNVDRYIVKAHHTPAQVVDIVNEVLGQKPT